MSHPELTDREKWERIYAEGALRDKSWYSPRLDPDFARTIRNRELRGRALDLGAGPGTQARALARRGFQVTASDISARALELASAEAAPSGLPIEWRQDDILDTRLRGSFDLILDRGCFHVIEPHQRPRYLAAVRRLLRPGGYLLLKCFSTREDEGQGPHRFTKDQLRATFDRDFRVRSIRDAVLLSGPRPPRHAHYAVLQRRPRSLRSLLARLR